MKAQEVYIKFESLNEKYYYHSIDELLEIGSPIDEEGMDMEQVDNNLYVIDGKNGYKILGE